jgi:tetratricopeptide (TPR) repeat protein
MDKTSPHRNLPHQRSTGVEDTQPHRIQGRKPSFWRKYGWLIFIPILLVAIILIAALTGYRSGLRMRQKAQASQEAQALLEQFNLAVEDLEAGRYSLAKQRAEYIISIEPGNTAAIGLLDLASQALNQPTLTPTPLITPTITTPSPTPDLSSMESFFQAANDAVARQDWEAALSLLIDLRAEYPHYRTAEVNHLVFQTLRNRGFNNILSGRLEEGIYDLTLAERFEPLDNQAASWRRTAEFYIFANSYVGLDWSQAYRWFADLCGAGVWDSCYKFNISASGFADQLIATNDPCGALPLYDQSIQYKSDANLIMTATQAANLCLTATATTPTMTPTLEETLTETPTVTSTSDLTTGTYTPTFTATPSPEGATFTPTPSFTPSPSPTATQSG